MVGAFNLPVVSHVIPKILCHLIAACPNGLTVEYMPWMLCLYQETRAIENGMLVLPDKPGLGLTFDEKAIEAKRPHLFCDACGTKLATPALAEIGLPPEDKAETMGCAPPPLVTPWTAPPIPGKRGPTDPIREAPHDPV